MSSSNHFSRGAMAAVFAALVPLSAAQLTTSCNPMNGSQFPCPADAGLCQTSTHVTDFTTGDDSNWRAADGTNLKYTSDGAEFTIADRYQAPTIETDFYIFYGRVSVAMKSSPGQGIVSSVTLASDVLDEIDWVTRPPPPPPVSIEEQTTTTDAYPLFIFLQEFLGGNNTMVHSDYFGKGNGTVSDREGDHAVATPVDAWHTYTIDWTEERIEWIIDDVTVRTLAAADALDGANFPQTPAKVRMGTWAGGDPAKSYWTRLWAGGDTTYSSEAGMPWTMTVAKVSITNYNPAESYSYTDGTGDSGSIAKGGAACK
ncbi:murein transglycosylase [Diplodia corticola]|uniref:Murein transglycosylase n=1 Tax=Diplodia corticola TaxID=236234 RepID=A0A1J9RHU1_9PEZI|nr:murein transglycosylase [Diplodia corticola]OJD32123.1 murein transglycosylase [Diplodia corticola]